MILLPPQHWPKGELPQLLLRASFNGQPPLEVGPLQVQPETDDGDKEQQPQQQQQQQQQTGTGTTPMPGAHSGQPCAPVVFDLAADLPIDLTTTRSAPLNAHTHTHVHTHTDKCTHTHAHSLCFQSSGYALPSGKAALHLTFSHSHKHTRSLSRPIMLTKYIVP